MQTCIIDLDFQEVAGLVLETEIGGGEQLSILTHPEVVCYISTDDVEGERSTVRIFIGVFNLELHHQRSRRLIFLSIIVIFN